MAKKNIGRRTAYYLKLVLIFIGAGVMLAVGSTIVSINCAKAMYGENYDYSQIADKQGG